jgi:hypothetical protein
MAKMADGIAGEKDLAENQEVRLVLDDEVSPAINCGLLGLLDFVPRPEVEFERVAQQYGTKTALALKGLEYAASVRILAVVLVEFGHQDRELGLVRGEARLAPLAAELGDVTSNRLGQVVQAGGDITRGHGAEDAERPYAGTLDQPAQSRAHVRRGGVFGGAAAAGLFRHRGVLVRPARRRPGARRRDQRRSKPSRHPITKSAPA